MMRWLLRLLVPEADRRAIESDLQELYAHRRRTDGDRAAARWLRRQRAAYPWRLLAARVRALRDARPSLTLWRDARYAVRSLSRSPGLTAAIVVTVGLGLGATSALVAVVRTVLLSPLPYARPESLVWIYTDNPPFRFRLSVVDYRALEADHPAFSAVAAYQAGDVTITDGEMPERVNAKSVSGSYFPMLGQSAILGRLFDGTDDVKRDRVVVLTAAYWKRRFGADPAVIGRTIRLDGEPHTVVGVLQERVGPLERDVALFTAERWPVPKRKGPFLTMVIGRVRDGVSPETAAATLRATNARLFPIWKSSYQDEKATWGLMDLKSRVLGDIGGTLWLALAAVVCVLLISCANAVNLLIARALGRARELAIRRALGASTGRLVQQILAETAVLTALAAAVGLGAAVLLIGEIGRYAAVYIPRANEMHVSAPILAWLGILSLASGALILAGSLGPAVRTVRRPDESALRAGGRSSTDGPRPRRIRRALVALEFVLATPLIVSAAIIALSFDRLSAVPVGVDTDRVFTAQIALSGGRYAEETARRAFWDRVLERVAAIPGVVGAALSDSRPPKEAGQQNNFDLEDHPTPAGQNQPVSTWVGVSPEFFAAAGITLERGRLLDDRSLENDEVVVDRAWAERFFGDTHVVGRRLKGGGCSSCPWTTVVGVVSTVKWTGLDAPDRGTVYFPFADVSRGFVFLRTAIDAPGITSAVRQAVRDLDPSLAVTAVATGDELMSDALSAPRSFALLAWLVAVAALALSLIGIYGVMAHFVAHHTRDIGIRLALGGEPAAVRRMIVRRGLGVVAVGVGIGLVAAFVVVRLIASRLFGVGAEAQLITAAAAPVLLLFAAAACLIPGRRAARLDPAEILRE